MITEHEPQELAGTVPSRRSRFDAAVRAHAGLVARIAASYERDRHRIDDLVQDVFLALWRALPSYRENASMATFLARIAHNVCVSHVRREVRVPPSQEGPEALDALANDTAAGPAQRAELDDQRRALLAAVRGLPLPQRQVVTLHLEGFSGRQIAEALDLTETNAAVRLTRARAALRKTLGEDR